MEPTVVFIDADDLVTYGTAHRFLLWLTDLIMRWTPEDEQEAA